MVTHPPSAPTTVSDVAREAGVSAATVSRILNGTAGVTDEKRQAVLAAVARLGYEPNPQARSLKMGRTMTVGILTQDVEGPYFTRLIVGVQQALEGSGYASIIVSGRWNAAAEAERVALLLARRIDGLVILSGHLPEQRVLEFARQRPTVITGRRIEGEQLRSVAVDQRLIGLLATRHLLALGHRRIAHIAGPADREDAVGRRAGYEAALAEQGLAPLVVQGDFYESGGHLAMERLLGGAEPFSAVFAANDQTAYGARMALYRRGIRVPDDLSLVGVDDLPGSAFTTPPLTTVRQPIHEMGHHAAATLLQMLGHATTPVAVPPPDLVLRETTRRV